MRSRVPNGFWKLQENQRHFLDNLAKNLGIKSTDDWYNITTKEIESNGGYGLLEQHNHSLPRTLQYVYPEKEWNILKFSRVPSKFWIDKANQKWFLETVAKKKKIEKPEDWHRVSRQDIIELGGKSLLMYYNDNLSKILQEHFPQYIHLESHRNPDYWNSTQNRRKFLEDFAQKVNIKHWKEWYQVKKQDIINYGGYSLLYKYELSIPKLLQDTLQEYPWNINEFGKLHSTSWTERIHHRNILDNISLKLGINKYEDWYKLKVNEFIEQVGESFIKIYRYSPVIALMSVYPEFEWQFWKFEEISDTDIFWKDKDEQKRYLEWLKEHLNIKDISEWYNVTEDTVRSNFGSGLLKKYSSLLNALNFNFPEHSWQLDHRDRLPKGYWKTFENRRNFLDKIAKEFNVKEQADWFRVKIQDIVERGGGGLLSFYEDSLSKTLAETYPEYSWEWKKWSYSGKIPQKSQLEMLNSLITLFPQEEIFMNFPLRNMNDKTSMLPDTCTIELDVAIPKLGLGFEYQGIQHYQDNDLYGDSIVWRKRDDEKARLCKENEVYLVTVPYWWGGLKESLLGSILEVLPNVQYSKEAVVASLVKPMLKNPRSKGNK